MISSIGKATRRPPGAQRRVGAQAPPQGAGSSPTFARPGRAVASNSRRGAATRWEGSSSAPAVC